MDARCKAVSIKNYRQTKIACEFGCSLNVLADKDSTVDHYRQAHFASDYLKCSMCLDYTFFKYSLAKLKEHTLKRHKIQEPVENTHYTTITVPFPASKSRGFENLKWCYDNSIFATVYLNGINEPVTTFLRDW